MGAHAKDILKKMEPPTDGWSGTVSRHDPRHEDRERLARFECQFAQSSRTLWCIASGILGDPHLAEDVLQEAALIAYRKLDQFDPETSFLAWSGRIVRFVALNALRKRRRETHRIVDPTLLEGTQDDSIRGTGEPIDSTGSLKPDQDQFDDRVIEALRTLAPTVRSCLLLRTVQDVPYRDIARVMNLPEGTVMSHVHRARTHLRQTIRWNEE